MKISKRHFPIIICAVVAIVLLIIFAILQFNDSVILKLESKWLIVAGVPILVGLIIGNYIKSFKGFGIELETLLESSISKINLIASDAIEVIKNVEKASVGYLDSLSNEARKNVKRLTFVSNKLKYYDANDIQTYLNRLQNLEYVEVQDNNKKFRSLIPINYFKDSNGYANWEKISGFINALEKDKLTDLLGSSMITQSVSEKDSIFDVLERAQNSPFGTLAVISANNELRGVVTDRLIEKRIAEEVLKTQNKKTE